MNIPRFLAIAASGWLMTTPATHADATLSIKDLQCEGIDSPSGIDIQSPRLGWRLDATDASKRGLRQTAWQVMAASTGEQLAKNEADLWDSGKTPSDESRAVIYQGKPPTSGSQVFWKVRVWDQDDAPSPWSAVSQWTMAMLQPGDWKAKWITCGITEKNAPQSLLLRREFQVKPGLRRAVAHVAGLGHYEMSINGRKAGDDLLSPGWTHYGKTVFHDTRDITTLLQPGANAAGILLGNGMYDVEKQRYTKFTASVGPQKALADIRLEYLDGSVDWVSTDNRWQCHQGPITLSHVYGGEDHDARLAQPGWDKPGFQAGGWQPAAECAGPGGTLRGLSVSNPPIRAFEVFQPASRREIRPGVIIYDMGQNASVMPHIRVKGSSGAIVRIIPGELLNKDGTVNQKSGGGPSYWQYTLAGTGSETWFPKFYYRGSRYQQVELTAAQDGALPEIESFETVMIHADSPVAGSFLTSNDLFNRIWTLVRWAQRSNMFSVMTDCPHREKLGWLEENHLNGPALRYNFDMGRMFMKIMNDMADAQQENGFVPNIAPEYVKFGGDGDANPFRNSPEWGSAFLLVAWQQYLFNGDLELLRRHYEAMKRYLAYLDAKATGGILDFGLGDWYDIGPKHPGVSQLTPRALTATAIYFEDVVVLAKSAKLLGKPDDAARFQTKAAEIRAAFNAKFFDAAHNTYATGSQTANAMPLVLDMVPPEKRQAVLDAVVADVRAKGLTAGDVGYRYLLRALADGGRSDVVHEMNNQSDKPGYGYQLRHGATSLTEAWDANPGPSQNHFMLGQINEWFFHDLAGIQPDPAAPGFKNVVLKPAITGDLRFVKAEFRSVRGRIESHWKNENGTLHFRAVIPPNSTATIHLPLQEGAVVTESGKPARSAAGVTSIHSENNQAVIQVGSGTYQFEVSPHT